MLYLVRKVGKFIHANVIIDIRYDVSSFVLHLYFIELDIFSSDCPWPMASCTRSISYFVSSRGDCVLEYPALEDGEVLLQD